MNYKLLSLAVIGALSITLTGCTLPGGGGDSGIFAFTPGLYSFAMDVRTQYLSGSQCPTQVGGFETLGDALVTTDPSAGTITVVLDDQTLVFNRLADNDYETDQRSFPALDGNDNPITGTAFFELTIMSEISANGTLVWDNTVGCKGFYPFGLNHLGPAT